MKRLIVDKLIKWKNSDKTRQPLMLLGARQVGKTYILKQFAKEHYGQYIYVNFETNLSIAKEFDNDITPIKIIGLLEIVFEQKILPAKTLLIFDEIQSCERAITSLKYFAEDAPAYHIIAAGSLLGVTINREKYSFPVGKVTILRMYPMDFEEFLLALNKTALIHIIKESFISFSPLPNAIHSEALSLFRKYLIIGGMPEVVAEFIENNNTLTTSDIQQKILDSYTADMAKYAKDNEVVKIKACFDSIISQLAKENKKFQYKIAQRGGTASYFGFALEWLTSAGIALKCQHIFHGLIPPAAYIDLPNFKIYMNDTGLLMLKSQVPQQLILLDDQKSIGFKGAITENYIAAVLVGKGRSLWYWTSGNTAEIDFVIINETEVIPVEVKSGTHIKSRSLSVYCNKYNPPYSIRFSEKNFGFENNIKSIPLYAAFCL
ncbi:MAG: ATP-binding protein [Bacteroidia bacterium]|nr:ATP-binding protein [Bacteroidia bacterium]